MTILDMLNDKHTDNVLFHKALDIIKDNFTNWVNDNYELILNEKSELMVKIPSLEKKNEYVYKNIGEYQYPLIMCMRIPEFKNTNVYDIILAKFLELYKDKLELLLKDVNTIDKLMINIKNKKSNIDCITYFSIVILTLGLISLCIFTNMSQMVKYVLILVMALSFIISVVMQFTKETQVKNIIDGYLSIIKTDWYKTQLTKEYSFLCNFIG